MGKKGISTTVSTLLVVVITIGLVGVVYTYISGSVTSKTAYVLEIVNVYDGSITLRNSGTAILPLGNMKVYVDGIERGFMSNKDS